MTFRNWSFHVAILNLTTQRQSSEGLSWQKIVEKVKKEARDVPKDTVSAALKELPLITRDIGI